MYIYIYTFIFICKYVYIYIHIYEYTPTSLFPLSLSLAFAPPLCPLPSLSFSSCLTSGFSIFSLSLGFRWTILWLLNHISMNMNIWMYMYIYVLVHVYICTYLHIWKYVHIYIDVYICIDICIHIFVSCVCTCEHPLVCVRLCVCVFVYHVDIVQMYKLFTHCHLLIPRCMCVCVEVCLFVHMTCWICIQISNLWKITISEEVHMDL